MSARRTWLIAIVAIIGVILLVCVAVAAFGVISFLMSGGADIPYPDGPPPTPKTATPTLKP